MANRRSFRKRQSVGEDSLNTLANSRARPGSSDPPEETRDGKLSASVRPEKIARAKRLVQDENYPSQGVLDSVAELLAKHLRPGEKR
jgi:hypothetical protein